MDQRHRFTDDRLTGFCVFCGASPSSQDHCPSKVLLDEPLPSNLPVVDACVSCNNNFSMDEQYLACLIEVAICGTVDPDCISRPNIRRMLSETPALSARINQARQEDDFGRVLWNIEVQRVRSVILKLARGHIAYELSLPKLDEPQSVNFVPLLLMSEGHRAHFGRPSIGTIALWPEIGSRAFIRAAKRFENPPADEWIVVQPGRYRYLVSQSEGDFVQIVLSEYLACHVVWQ